MATPTGTPTTTPTAAPNAANPNLGTAAFFGVSGDTAVANTGLSTVTGDVGVSPGYAVSGFPPGMVVDGAIHVGDAAAVNAHTDVQTAFANAAAQPCQHDLTGLDLGGRTISAGVWCYAAAAALTGTLPLTLDGGGNANAVFVFKIGSTLDTAAASSVALSNGAQACNVFWQVGSAAGLGANTRFAGNILASTAITSGAGVTNQGGLYTLTGAVTLGTNQIAACAVTPPGSRSASLANLALPSMVYSNQAGQASGTMTLTVDDATGSDEGWHVTIQSSTFVYGGDSGGTDIPGDHFSITGATPPILTAGQAIDAAGGPKVPTTGVTSALDQPRTVLQASPGFGAGTYTQDLAVRLSIPSQSRVGTYTGTLTTSISAAP